MKKIMYLLSIGLMVILLGCGAPTSTTPAKEATQPAKVITAEGISDSFKNGGLPMTDIVVYTEETDTNKLMGRPNQYISKVNFMDSRVTDSKKGGSIEDFSNAKDAKNRNDYIESVTKDTLMLLQYMYLKGNALLRIDKDLTPTQAKEYETALGKIIKLSLIHISEPTRLGMIS